MPYTVVAYAAKARIFMAFTATAYTVSGPELAARMARPLA